MSGMNFSKSALMTMVLALMGACPMLASVENPALPTSGDRRSADVVQELEWRAEAIFQIRGARVGTSGAKLGGDGLSTNNSENEEYRTNRLMGQATLTVEQRYAFSLGLGVTYMTYRPNFGAGNGLSLDGNAPQIGAGFGWRFLAEPDSNLCAALSLGLRYRRGTVGAELNTGPSLESADYSAYEAVLDLGGQYRGDVPLTNAENGLYFVWEFGFALMYSHSEAEIPDFIGNQTLELEWEEEAGDFPGMVRAGLGANFRNVGMGFEFTLGVLNSFTLYASAKF